VSNGKENREVSEIRRALNTCATAAIAALCISLLAATSSLAVTVTPVVKGLDNPRGLAFDSDGHLFVAEAGHGGKECSPEPGPGGEEQCVGFTSGVSRIDNGVAHRVVSDQVSVAGPDGTAAIGIDGISILRDWRIFGVVGESRFAVPPKGFSVETTEKAKAQLGRLDEFTPNHGRVVADVGGFDFKWSEEHKKLVPEQFPDANPYSVLATPDGQWVIDAASNTLDWVHEGSVKVVTFFPSPKVSDAVPTCISRGPDGALYVGELTGAGNGPGTSVVWRVVPGQEPTMWAKGLTGVTGCGFDTDGDFFAVEFSTLGWESFKPETGALVRVPPHSTSPITVVSKLSFPNGFAARPHQIYVSNWSIAPAQGGPGGVSGEVLRITH
jgi:sugar lactone lactonase YvrE